MKNETSIKVQDNKIIINDDTVYDFDNRYHNISALGVEQQIQIYNSVITSNLSVSEKNEFTFICAYLFKAFSAKNSPVHALVIGNNHFIKLIANIIKLFNEENKLYHICETNEYNSNNTSNNIISIVENKFYNTNFLSNNIFAAVFIDLDFIKNNIETVLSEYARLIDGDGVIICYGSSIYGPEIHDVLSDVNASFYQPNPERFLVSISLSNMNGNISQSGKKEEILKIIEQESAKLIDNLKYIMSNRPASLDDIWYSIIDDCIYIVDQMEAIITKNYMLFENKDLKYQTNEVKNALLDFKYEAYLSRKYYDSFQAILFDCYNDWVSSIW